MLQNAKVHLTTKDGRESIPPEEIFCEAEDDQEGTASDPYGNEIPNDDESGSSTPISSSGMFGVGTPKRLQSKESSDMVGAGLMVTVGADQESLEDSLELSKDHLSKFNA